MSIDCQRNGYWAATNHLSGRGLVQPIKELSSVAGRCAGKGCVLIRQLANCSHQSVAYWRSRLSACVGAFGGYFQAVL